MIANMLIHVIDVECVGPRALRVWFDDDTVKDVDLTNELWGEVFGCRAPTELRWGSLTTAQR